ncbi:unnamed protein product [Prunus brigantina]
MLFRNCSRKPKLSRLLPLPESPESSKRSIARLLHRIPQSPLVPRPKPRRQRHRS